MRVKVVTLRFDPRVEGFDDAPLEELGSGISVMNVLSGLAPGGRWGGRNLHREDAKSAKGVQGV